jgi:hypothetical protein
MIEMAVPAWTAKLLRIKSRSNIGEELDYSDPPFMQIYKLLLPLQLPTVALAATIVAHYPQISNQGHQRGFKPGFQGW